VDCKYLSGMPTKIQQPYLTSVAGAVDCGIDAVMLLSQALPVNPLNDGGVLLLVSGYCSKMDHFV
jgi:hypothetical protein